MDPMIVIYGSALEIARRNKQTVGEKNEYYVTLEQLEALMRPYVQDKTKD